MSDKAIVISGEENVKAVRSIARLHYWRFQAQMRALGFKPRKGYTIRAFNAEYGHKARSWAEVAELANGTILSFRGES